MTDPALEFIDAFNRRELDRFVAVLDPEVELHSMRGLRRGLEAAREWATRPPGGVQQEIVVDRVLREPGADPANGEAAAGKVVVMVERRWTWEEDDSSAGVDLMAWAFELRGGRVLSWRPYEDRAAALREAGF